MAESAQDSPSPEAPEEPVDAFILFNEGEDIVEGIVGDLSLRDISTYFWRRDIPVGERWREVENAQLRNARAVVIFLGSKGWGPNHLRLAGEAQELEKRIIPVLIGDPPNEALAEAGGLFERLRYLDLRIKSAGALARLADAIRPRDRGPRFSGIINTLVDGNDEQRADILRQISKATVVDRQALSARLRDEIQHRFGPEREDQFASADREPKKIASIRSWMLSCLIGIDAEQALNRALVLEHLNARSEPNRNVRFWALAGLYQRKASYLGEARSLCLSDSAPEVAVLARAITDPPIEDFRSMLYSPSFETAWAVLRLLRIVPLKTLAPDVCAQLDRVAESTELTYDSLYALANPEMAAEAAPLLLKAPGLKGFIWTVVSVLANSDGNAARAFALLLIAFEATEVEAAFAEIEQDRPDSRTTIRILRRYFRLLRQGEVSRELFVAGYASDTIDVEQDYLDIREDVQTLTAVILAIEVNPPLAIGLFGDWGSGKSYFMQSMKAAVKAFTDKAKNLPDSKFCSRVVSIEFNAWHYADTNLWASLVSHILESLAAYVSPAPTSEQQQAELIQQLDSAKAAVAQIEKEKESTDKQITERQTELQELRAKREQKEVELRELRLSDLQSVLSAQPEVKRMLTDSLEQMGVPATIARMSDLGQAMAEVNSLRGRATALVVGLFNAQNKQVVIGLTVCLIAIPFLAAWLYEYLANSLVVVGTVVAEATIFIGGIVTFLRKAAGHVKTHLAMFEDAKKQVDGLLAQKRKTPGAREVQLEQEIAGLKAKEDQVASRMRAATAKVIDLEQRIAALKESRSLTHFLAQRTQSDDYRKHLGLISTIRRDFEALTKALAESPADQTIARVERIILYIDDLDRCPADKVVDVLQAVHLLLAYPLFVVVVGVDPRWLAQSLTERYSALRGGRRSPVDRDMWRTTPQNYLEKIFQIPVSLRPMTAEGYARLVQGLFAATGAEPRRPASSGSDSAGSPPRSGAGAAHSDSAAKDAKKNGEQARDRDRDRDRDQGTSKTRDDAFVINEDALVIKPVEANFAEDLYRLMPSPRATKRFSNIYRILKASTAPDQLQTFEGTEQWPGTFQVPMLLLAILIGMPSEAAALFPKLYERVRIGDDPIDALGSIDAPTLAKDKIALFRDRVNEIVSESSFPRSPELFADWLPRVSRFSFEIGRAFNPAFVGRARL